MKKIIAAALSILVGTFGYTIVDQAIEDRMSTLESQVVLLEENDLELRNHIESLEDVVNNLHTTRLINSTTQKYTTTQLHEITTQKVVQEGRQLLRYDSNNKFMFYKYPDGRTAYVPKGNLNELTTWNTEYSECYLSVNYVSATLTNIENKEIVDEYYDSNYNICTQKSTETVYLITVNVQGTSDIDLAGYRVEFILSLINHNYEQEKLKLINCQNNSIADDGSFNATYVFESSKMLDAPYEYDIMPYSLDSALLLQP